MKKNFYNVFALTFLIILIYWRWFFTIDTFTYGDWWWYFKETAQTFLSFPQIWLHSGFGGVDIGLSQYLTTKFAYGLFSNFGNFQLADRVVFFYPSVILPVLSSYYLAQKILKSTPGAVASVIVYSLNTYLMTIRSGHLTLAVAFGIAPLILALYIESLNEKNIRKAILCGFASFLCFSYEPRAFYLIVCVMASYAAFVLINYNYSFKTKIQQFWISALPIILVILLSLYGIIGLYFASGVITDTVLTRSLFGAGYVNIQRGFALYVNEWPELSKNPGYALGFSFYFWLVPFSALVGLWLGRKVKKILFFGFITLIGIFLVKMTNLPFGEIYPWLYSHVPGFNAFREPSKFYFLIGLGYSILIGNLVKAIWDYLGEKNHRIHKLILISILLSPFLINAFLAFRGEHGELHTARNLPNDYVIYKNFLDSNPGEYRTLFVPEVSRWGYWDKKIRIIGATTLSITKFPEISDYRNTGLEYRHTDHIMNIFEKSGSDDIFDKLSIRYVVIPTEDKENEEQNIFNWGSRSEYVNRISKLNYLKLIDIGTNELLVYENADYHPIFYWAKDIVGENNEAVGLVEAKYESSSQIELLVKNISPDLNELVINFSETYDPRWRLRNGDFNWIKSVFEKNYFLQTQPIESNLNTNYFVIKPGDLVQKQNSPYDLSITLYFAPQAWVNLGTIISIFSLLSALTALLVIKNSKL